MGKTVNTPFLLLLSLSLSTTAISTLRGDDGENACVYTIYVRTGSVWKGGTDATIGVALAGSDGEGVLIPDLTAWGGLMEEGHDYYERGNLDIFSGRAPCLESKPCWLNVTSDGSGQGHGWYCNYVEVTVTGPHQACGQQLFTVEQWLATDAAPKQLWAERDLCPPPPEPAVREIAGSGQKRARGARALRGVA